LSGKFSLNDIFSWRDKFSTFFVEDAISPQYTACVAVLVFRELQSRNILYVDNLDIDDCYRGKDFSVPEGHIPPAGTGHCWSPKYKYTGKVGKKTYLYDRLLVKKTCEAAIYPNISSPNEAYHSIVNYLKHYFNHDGSRKSTWVK